jgi:hypothetical protein
MNEKRDRSTAEVGVLIVVAIFAVSFAQPIVARGRDIRLEAVRSIVVPSRSYMGDPGPSVYAARRLANDARASVYQANLLTGSAFIYPPLAAAAYRPIAFLPFAEAHMRLAAANRALLAVIAIELAVFLAGARRLRWSDGVIAVCAVPLFYPLVHAVELNQATVFLTALLGGAFLALDRRSEALAGALFAMTLAFKPQLVLALPLLFWHARRMVVSAVATACALFVLSLAYAGVDNHVAYASRVLPTLSRGYAYYANFSFNGLFNRLFTDGDIGIFAMPPPNAAVRALTFGFGAATYGSALFLVRRSRAAPELAPWIFAFAWLVATMISPIAWQHHYAPALFVFALLLRTIRADSALLVPRFVVPIAVAFALMASYFEVRALTGALARVAASYLFFGAVALAATLAVLISERARARILRS